MTTPLYPIFEKRIHDATEQLLRKQIEPWAFLNSGHPVKVKTFDGHNISYQGVGFEGSPRVVFWSRYMEPFLENLTIEEISVVVKAAREKRVDAKLLLLEVQSLLLSASRQIFSRMAETDQRLLGKGNPKSVPLRPIENEVTVMKEFIEKHILAELGILKLTPWYEKWFENNKFLVWVVSMLVAVMVGYAIKSL